MPGAQDRITSLDIVRGVAVLGIVIANIVGLGQPMTAAVWPGAFLSDPGPLADWLWGAQLVFVDGKLRGIFTLLFGAGLAAGGAVQFERGLPQPARLSGLRLPTLADAPEIAVEFIASSGD